MSELGKSICDSGKCSLRCWKVWSFLVTLVVVMQCWTMALSPVVWQDEVEIVELGRVFLEPETPWSIIYIGDQIPQPALRYLGPLMSELAYLWSGGNFMAPRVLGLLGAVLFGTSLLLWLRIRGVAESLALSVSFLMLIDPVFERSYRGGRIDAWPLFFAVIACWCMRRSVFLARGRGIWLFAAGALVGILPIMWPTGVLLWPLIFVEFVGVVRLDKAAAGKTKAFTLLIPLAGMLASTASVLIPVWPLVVQSAIDIFHHIQWDVTVATTTGGGRRDVISSLIAVLRYSPFWIALAMVGVVDSKDRLLALVFVISLLVVAGTRFYLYRYIYVLPCMAPLVVSGIQKLSAMKPFTWLPKAGCCVTIAALLWACVLTFGVRNYVALQERPWRDHYELVSVMKQNIGNGPLKVYMGTYDVYYAGRMLNWQMYRQVFRLPKTQMDRVFNQCDVLIMVTYEDTPEFQEQIKSLGFDKGITLHVGPRAMPIEFQKPRYGGRAYGPYRVYRRLSAQE